MALKMYEDYMGKIGDRLKLYKAVAETMDIKSAVYPGSHVDITPSLVIPNVTYIDNFAGTKKFFSDVDCIKDFIAENKIYTEPFEITFLGQDYTVPLDINSVDLIISQYAGFVGHYTKGYLKSGGVLLCNDSHGDATMAKMDPDFEFIGVIESSATECKFSKNNITDYFVLTKNRQIHLENVISTMRGPNYILKAENYVFRKI